MPFFNSEETASLRKQLEEFLKDSGLTAQVFKPHYPVVNPHHPDTNPYPQWPDTNPYPQWPDTNPFPERRWPFPGTASPAPKSPLVKDNAQNHTFNCVLIRNAENYILKAYLAGVDKNSISIALSNDVLQISAQTSGTQQNESCILDEQPKSFSRKITIPKDIDCAEMVPATYLDGVLEIIIPRKTVSKVDKNIPVA